MTREEKYMLEAIKLSEESLKTNAGGPFGCVIVKDDVIIGRGNNRVTSTNDPTAHAEVVAIREACKTIQSFQLDGCEIYTSCEPCPMCLGALYWARPRVIYYANTRQDAANIEFDDSLIYNEINSDIADRIIPMKRLSHPDAVVVFEKWKNKTDKEAY